LFYFKEKPPVCAVFLLLQLSIKKWFIRVLVCLFLISCYKSYTCESIHSGHYSNGSGVSVASPSSTTEDVIIKKSKRDAIRECEKSNSTEVTGDSLKSISVYLTTACKIK